MLITTGTPFKKRTLKSLVGSARARAGTPGTRAALALTFAGTTIRVAGGVIGKELDARREASERLQRELADTRLQLWALETVLHHRDMITPEEFQAAYEDGRLGKFVPPEATPGAVAVDFPSPVNDDDLPAGAVPEQAS